MDYFIHLGILVCIYLILAQAFNIPFGVGRMFNLAHVAVYALGAYTTALLSTEAGWSFFPCVVASMFVSGIFSLLIGGISLKLTHDYFAIGTIAFSSVVSALLINWKSLTRGVLGIPGIPRPDIAGIDFYDNRNFLWLVIIFMLLSQFVVYVVLKNSFGRSIRAQSEYEQGASTLGYNVTAIRNAAFVVSSALAGIAGSFYAYYINYIDPSSFSLTEMIFVLTIVVVGRPGSFWGVVFATFFLVLLPEPLRFIDIPASILGPMRQMIYALILFSVVYWKRATLFPVHRSI